MKYLAVVALIYGLGSSGLDGLTESAVQSIETGAEGKAISIDWFPPPADQGQDASEQPEFVPAPDGAAGHDDTGDHGHGHDWGAEAEAAGYTLCVITDPTHPWYGTGKITACEECGPLCAGGEVDRDKRAEKAQAVAP